MNVEYTMTQQTFFSSSSAFSDSMQNQDENSTDTTGFDNLLREKYHCPFCNSNEQVPVNDTQSTLSSLEESPTTDVLSLINTTVGNLMEYVSGEIEFTQNGVADFGDGREFAFLPDGVSDDFAQAVSTTLSHMQQDGTDNGSLMTITSIVSYELKITLPASSLGENWDDGFGFSKISAMVDEYGMMFRSSDEQSTLANAMEQFFAHFEALWDDLGLSKTESQSSESQRHPSVEAFLKKLDEKGPMGMVYELNQEKIEALLEKRREQLEEQQGLNSNPPLPQDQLIKAKARVEELMRDYEKELREQLKMQDEEKALEPEKQLQTLLQTV